MDRIKLSLLSNQTLNPSLYWVTMAKMLEALLQSLLVSLNITSQKPKAIYPLSSTIKPFFFYI